MALPYITVIYGIAFPTQILISPLCHHGYLRVGWSLNGVAFDDICARPLRIIVKIHYSICFVL